MYREYWRFILTTIPQQKLLYFGTSTRPFTVEYMYYYFIRKKITPLFNQFYGQKTSMQTKPREQKGVERPCFPAPPPPQDVPLAAAVMRCGLPSSDAMFLSLEITFLLPVWLLRSLDKTAVCGVSKAKQLKVLAIIAPHPQPWGKRGIVHMSVGCFESAFVTGRCGPGLQKEPHAQQLCQKEYFCDSCLGRKRDTEGRVAWTLLTFG